MENDDDKVVVVVSKFKRICVFCGSSQGNKTSYQDAAIELAKELVIFLLLFLFGDFQSVVGFLQKIYLFSKSCFICSLYCFFM